MKFHYFINLPYILYRNYIIFLISTFCLYPGIVSGALPHASQQGILHPFRTYADVTLFHFSVPPELSRATWEFVAFMDSPDCPARDVHIYLQHGSYPVMSADNSSFPQLLYVGRSSLHWAVTQATYHGLQPGRRTPERRRAVLPVYAPLPGDWFVAAFLSNWDQQLTQQGIGHKCHYSLFGVVLWSSDTEVETITPGLPTSLITRRTFSYFRFYVPEGVQHLSVRVSSCQLQVDTAPGSPCLAGLSLRARALPLPPARGHAPPQDPYEEGEEDIREWGQVGVEHAELREHRPHTETHYYLMVVAEAQASFTLLVNMSACQKFDLRDSWARLLNGGSRSENSSLSPGPLVRSSGLTLHTANSSHPALNSSLALNTSMVEEAAEPSAARNLSTEPSCFRTFQLTRIQHSQEFSSTFLLQVEEFFISSLLLPDSEPVLVRLDVLPFLDIGGSLSIGLQLDTMLLALFPSRQHELTVRACLRKGRPPPLPHDLTPLRCPSELALHLSSRAEGAATLLVPFPEPGAWFLALQATCFTNGISLACSQCSQVSMSQVPCIAEELGLDLDVRIQPCVFAGEPCGPRGECERTHHGLHTVSSCLCFGGFSGWGCTDGRGAHAPSRQLLGTLSLTLSNLLFLPAVALAARRRLLAEALIYLATAFFSILYHACDEPEYSFCVAKYEVLQFCDFFCSILAFWVTLISLAKLPPRLAAAAHMAGVLMVAVGVEWNRTALLVFLVPVALGLLVPVVAWLVRGWRAGVPLRVSRASLLRLAPGVLLSALGLALFAMVETETNYQFVHSAWHMLMGLALLFLLPDGQERSSAGRARGRRASSPPLLDASSQELCDVSSEPVFVLPPPHQPLVTSLHS